MKILYSCFCALGVQLALGLAPGASVRAQGGNTADIRDVVAVNPGDSTVYLNLKTAYTVPTANVYYYSPSGNNTAPTGDGSAAKPWRTPSQTQIDAMPGGSTLVFKQGGYEVNDLKLNKVLTLQPYRDPAKSQNDEAWLTGSISIKNSTWTPATLNNVAVWKTAWSEAYQFPVISDETIKGTCPAGDKRSVTQCPKLLADQVAGHPDMVFLNNRLLKQIIKDGATGLVGMKAGRYFYVDRDNDQLYIGFNPSAAGVQSLAATAYGFGLEHATTNLVTVQGLGLRNYAQAAVRSWNGALTMKDCTVAWNATEGLNSGSDNYNVTLLNNTFTWNGRLGANFGTGNVPNRLSVPSLVIKGNTFSRNNHEGFANYWSAGGMKLIKYDDLTIEGNTFAYNFGTGLWLDLDVENVKVLNNVAVGNSSIGLFYEVSRGGLLAGNTCYKNGTGIEISGSSGVAVFNNTLVANGTNLNVSDYSRLNYPERDLPKTATAKQIADETAAGAAQRERGILYETFEIKVKNNVFANASNYNLYVDNIRSAEEPENGIMIQPGNLNTNLYLRWDPQPTTQPNKSGIHWDENPSFDANGNRTRDRSFPTLAAFKAAQNPAGATAATGFDIDGQEITGTAAKALFADADGGDFRLKPCAVPQGESLPAANQVGSGLVVAKNYSLASPTSPPANGFSLSASDYRGALGLGANATAATLVVGSAQTTGTCAVAQSITFTSPTQATVGQPLTLTSTSTGNAAVAVTYSVVGSTPAGIATLAAGTNALAFTGAGTVTVRATKAASAGYLSATADAVITVAAAPQTITFPPIAGRVYGDADIVLNATSSAGLPITYTVNSPAAVLLADGKTVRITGTGNVKVTASQAGNAAYNAAPDVMQAFTVNKGQQTITFDALPDVDLYSGPVALSATSTGDATIPVTFSLVNTPASVATLSGTTLTLVGPGTVTVRASKAGDYLGNRLPAPDVDRTFVVRGVVLALNAGGPAYASAATGINYAAEGSYVSGGTALARPTRSVAVAANQDAVPYQTERYGDFAYALPVPAGTYELTLQFAELYFGADVPGSAGQRVFDVLLENETTPALANLDVFQQAGGANKALLRTLTRTVADGTLNVQLRSQPGKNAAQLCALIVKRVSDPAGTAARGGAPAPAPGAASNAFAGSAALSATSVPASSVSLYPNPAQEAVNLRFDAMAQPLHVVVLNQLGQVVHQQAVAAQTGPNEVRVPVSALPPGLYLLQLRAADGGLVLHQQRLQVAR